MKINISKSGSNVLTETDVDNLIFSSDYNTLKYDTSGETTLTVNYSSYYYKEIDILGTWYYHRKVETVAHNLSFFPFFAAFVNHSTDKWSFVPFQLADVGFSTELYSTADDTNLYFILEERNQSNSGTKDFDFSYKIFKNDLGL